MTHHFALSPDVNVRDLSHWFVFNTRLQKLTGETLRLVPYDDFAAYHQAIEQGQVDLVFANAADTARLVRGGAFVPLASPAGVSDEAVVAVAAAGAARTLDDLAPGPLDAAAADAPDVERICRILLEAADLRREAIRVTVKRNPVLVAKAVIAGETAAGFFLAAAYDELAESTRALLRPLARSHIYVVRHSLLVGARLLAATPRLHEALDRISTNEDDGPMLAGMGTPGGWAAMSADDAEFLADLVEALES